MRQAETGFESTPIPSTATSTRSPGCIGATPAGVPVGIKSPGSRVIAALIYRSRAGMEKIRSRVFPCCRRLSFSRVSTLSPAPGSISSVTMGPTGQKVSKPLARDHCPSGRPADNDGQLPFEINALRLRRNADRRSRSKDRRWRLQKEQRLFRNFVTQLSGVVAIVAPDADDLRGHGRREQLSAPKRQRLKAGRLGGAGQLGPGIFFGRRQQALDPVMATELNDFAVLGAKLAFKTAIAHGIYPRNLSLGKHWGHGFGAIVSETSGEWALSLPSRSTVATE